MPRDADDSLFYMSFGIYSFYRLFQPRFRSERMRLFLETFKPGPETTILDIGGNVYDWDDVPITSKITVLNLAHTDSSPSHPERFQYICGDGRDLPFPDKSFDIVYANSVIEHLRTEEDQRLFAMEAMRVGRAIFIQTPNRWFPVEPHFISLFVQYLPRKLHRWLLPLLCLRRFLTSEENINSAELAAELRLLSRNDLKNLFPGTAIHSERLLLMPKSFTALPANRCASSQ